MERTVNVLYLRRNSRFRKKRTIMTRPDEAPVFTRIVAQLCGGEADPRRGLDLLVIFAPAVPMYSPAMKV